MSNCIRDRLKTSGMTQVRLIQELTKRGVSTNPSELSYILSGVINGPKANTVIKLCNEILDEIGADVDAHKGSD